MCVQNSKEHKYIITKVYVLFIKALTKLTAVQFDSISGIM